MEQLARAAAAGGPMGDQLRQAVERWKAWFGRRDELAARVLPEVAHWEWSAGRRHSLLPLHFQRYPGRGRVLKTAPQPRSQHTESGLAADGRLLVEVTDDFVAFAVDPEMDDLEEALAASAPPERIADWRARGWL